MADEQRLLQVNINNQEPLQLALLAAFYEAISKDYKRFSGHELTLYRIETGSVWSWFFDHLDTMNALGDFAGHLGKLFKLFKTDKRKLTRSRRPGARTIGALAEVSRRSSATIEVRHTEPDGTIYEFKITPHEVIEADYVEVSITVDDDAEVQSSPGLTIEDLRVKRLTDATAAALGRRGDDSQPFDEQDGLLILIRAMVEEIRKLPEGKRILDKVEQALRQRGLDPSDILR